ncbi:MAG: nitroreductase [Lachnospiraceae bacterium]|nr:nitroreductase [Lachnospiraceae bacterium]
MAAVQAIYNRRSIRRFQEKSVPEDVLEELLNAGRAAPSAKNRQPWKYIVFGGAQKQELLKVMEAGILNTNAKSPFLPVDNDEHITELCDTLSIGALIENMLLAAEELGLGTLWIANTCFAYRELVTYLETEQQLVGAVAVGYPDETPSQRPRKQLEDFVEYRI